MSEVSAMNASTDWSALAAQTSAAATNALAEAQNSSTSLGLVGRLILAILKVIPGLLFWIITFGTITLPTWIFTVASMSLTVTMNATTL